MARKITKFKDIVLDILENHPRSRDDDNILYFYLVQELDKNNPLMNYLDLFLKDYLKAVVKGELPSIPVISRARRLIQEKAAKDPDKKYLCGNRKVKKELADEVSAEIINEKTK
jgi:hypothetical protein